MNYEMSTCIMTVHIINKEISIDVKRVRNPQGKIHDPHNKI